MNTISFAQAQSNYDNMLPEDDGSYEYLEEGLEDFRSESGLFPGRMVKTEDGVGVITKNWTGTIEEDSDGEGVYHVSSYSVEVVLPFIGGYFYSTDEIKIMNSKKEWVSI